MLRELVLASLVVVAALSGCLESPGLTETPAGEVPAASVTATPGRVAVWHTLSVRAAPDAALAGFWWTVPEGAPVKDELFSYEGETRTSVVLEVALLDEEDNLSRIQEWALLAFAKDDGKLYPLAEAASTPVHMRTPGPLGDEAETSDVFHAPFFLRLGPDVLDAGDKVGFVLAARAADPMDVRLGFRVLTEDPGFDEDPADDAEEFLSTLDARAPVALAPAGSGEGLQYAMYLDFEGVLVLPFGFEAWTDSVQVDGEVSPDLRPAAAARDQTFSATFDSPAGYAASSGFYFAQHAIGSWSAEADLRGESLAAGGPIVEAPNVGLLTYLLFGSAGYFAIGDGEGPSASSMTLQTATVNANGFEVLVFAQSDLGAPLATLLGEDGMTLAATFDGILPGAALRVDGAHLTLSSAQGGPHRTLLGVVPQA